MTHPIRRAGVFVHGKTPSKSTYLGQIIYHTQYGVSSWIPEKNVGVPILLAQVVLGWKSLTKNSFPKQQKTTIKGSTKKTAKLFALKFPINPKNRWQRGRVATWQISPLTFDWNASRKQTSGGRISLGEIHGKPLGNSMEFGLFSGGPTKR